MKNIYSKAALPTNGQPIWLFPHAQGLKEHIELLEVKKPSDILQPRDPLVGPMMASVHDQTKTSP